MHPDAQTLANIRAARTYHERAPENYLVPYRHIAHLLENRASESPEKTFLIAYDADGTRTEYTYADFNAQVNRAANLLWSLGIRPNDRVATLAYNHAETVILYCACWKLGATLAPQNATEDDARIAFILRNSEAVALFVRHDYLERAARILSGASEGSGAPNVRRVVQMGGAPHGEIMHFSTELAVQAEDFSTPDHVSLESEALLVYTSGTTGAPKGVVLTQYNLLVDARGISDWQGITGNQRMMCVLPIHHVNGIVVTLITPLYVGGSLVLNRQFQSQTFWARIAAEKVHIVSVVPTLLQFCCEYADAQQASGKSIWGDHVRRGDLTHFRHIICGAGTLSVALTKRFEDQFDFPILHGYGLSETTCYSCFLPIDLGWHEHQDWLQRHGYPSIGCPISPNEMAIFDPSGSGVPLGEGERGEICIRGHNVMKYYFQRPEANAETFKFGWFRSGDEGFFLSDSRGRQFFFITGRIKELINRGGVKFSPFDIEEVLLSIAGVKVGLAIAFENNYYGEEVGAYVVLEEGAALTEAQILAACRAKLTFEKAPKVVVFGTEVPVTTTGKYQRLKLRDHFTAWRAVQFRP
ncbi:MAG: long-chain fatty acid--CoA ligase [Chloroflexi bacterium CFX4]|nr:long-chain fatty acid--CoA ligase [Chloroflexi bacterium CFX4]MDL1922809.1 acyl--CoA ligase [Chloroflexi bacterium CFX3]